nr:MAG TPA: hypothetical protein [Caudoviricetes sp.]
MGFFATVLLLSFLLPHHFAMTPPHRYNRIKRSVSAQTRH